MRLFLRTWQTTLLRAESSRNTKNRPEMGGFCIGDIVFMKSHTRYTSSMNKINMKTWALIAVVGVVIVGGAYTLGSVNGESMAAAAYKATNLGGNAMPLNYDYKQYENTLSGFGSDDFMMGEVVLPGEDTKKCAIWDVKCNAGNFVESRAEFHGTRNFLQEKAQACAKAAGGEGAIVSFVLDAKGNPKDVKCDDGKGAPAKKK